MEYGIRGRKTEEEVQILPIPDTDGRKILPILRKAAEIN